MSPFSRHPYHTTLNPRYIWLFIHKGVKLCGKNVEEENHVTILLLIVSSSALQHMLQEVRLSQRSGASIYLSESSKEKLYSSEHVTVFHGTDIIPYITPTYIIQSQECQTLWKEPRRSRSRRSGINLCSTTHAAEVKIEAAVGCCFHLPIWELKGKALQFRACHHFPWLKISYRT